MKTSIISLFLIVFLFGTTMLSAQPHQKKEGKKQMMEQLNLSEDQKSQVEKLHTSHQDQMTNLKSKLNIKEAELDAAILAENSSEAKSLVRSINQLNGEKLANKIEHQLAVKALLNDDQKRKFDQMILAKGKRSGPGQKMHQHDRGQQQRPRGNRSGQGGS